MDITTKRYIDNLDIKDVPWDRMFTAYDTAEHYPELLSKLEETTDINLWGNTYRQISDFEHQSTMFPPAPFVLVFLVRILRKLLEEGKADDIVRKMLNLFEYYIDICINAERMEHAEAFKQFSDLLDDKNLLPKNFSDEELLDIFEDPKAISDELFYSIYHYSLIVLSQIPDILDRYNRFPDVSKKLRETMEIVASLSEQDR